MVLITGMLSRCFTRKDIVLHWQKIQRTSCNAYVCCNYSSKKDIVINLSNKSKTKDLMGWRDSSLVAIIKPVESYAGFFILQFGVPIIFAIIRNLMTNQESMNTLLPEFMTRKFSKVG